MIIEIHTHTIEHSPCSQIKAIKLVESIFIKGFGGVVLTDHHYLWTENELCSLRTNAEIPEDFLVLAGQEVFTKDFGDILVYGAHESISTGLSLMDLRRKYPEAALVWAHPYRSGQQPTEIELFNPNLDAIEILNPHQKEMENQRGIADWRTWGFTATSGSDIHKEESSEFYPTYLNCVIKDIQGLAACIKEGRCSPELGPAHPVEGGRFLGY